MRRSVLALLFSCLFVFSCCLLLVQAFKSPKYYYQSYQTTFPSSTSLFYDYFKKGPEKKEIGRLWKNIIFPGIYVEYADTKEPKKTIKIEGKKAVDTGRSEVAPDLKQGTYQTLDSRYTVTYDNVSGAKGALKPPTKPSNFVAPTPKKATDLNSNRNIIQCVANVGSYPRPKKPLVIYEYETDSQCKKVREACSMLDLIVEYRPCPGARSGFSDLMATVTLGKRNVPYLVDTNPSMYKPELFGSDEIVEYLFKTYGPGAAAIPASLKGGEKKGLFGGSSSSSGKGSKLRSDARGDITKLKPITVFGVESAPYVKPVREVLNELGLAHVFVNVANGSQNRSKLTQKTKGYFQIPYISDPNTGVEMFESAEIVKYLEQTYTVPK